MKYIHSLWSNPSGNSWHTVENNERSYFNMTLLSVLLVKKLGYNIELYCDEQIANKYSKIPYDKINIINFDDQINSIFWNWSKIKAQSLVNEPFVHIDNDVFLFRDVVSDKLSGEKYKIVVQQIENKETIGEEGFDDVYTRNNIILKDKFDIQWNKYDNFAYNCGVIGFNDMEFKNKYTSKVKEIFQNFSKDEKFITHIKSISLNSILMCIEQGLLYYMLKEENIEPFIILPTDKKEEMLTTIPNNIGFTHLWGNAKFKHDIINAIKYKLKRYFPEYSHLIK